MPKVKVRHALVPYRTQAGLYENAFRGQVLDMPQSEVDRLRPQGAVVDPDQELERPGTMRRLPESPSDEELVSWVMDATTAEVAVLAAERPNLSDRLRAAQGYVENVQEAQRERLARMAGVAEEAADANEANPAHLASGLTAATGDESGAQGRAGAQGAGNDAGLVGETQHVAGEGDTVPPAGTPGAPPQPTTPELPGDDEVVQGDWEDVVRFVSEHPERAAGILEAEVAYRRAADKDARPSIVKAVEAAAGHTA